MQRIYLDHNATTPVHPAVLEAMLPYFGAEFGNPSSVHQFGQRASHAIEQARESVAALIGARSSEIVFTSGGTEADNAAIFGVIGHALRAEKRSSAAPPHLITTVIEHDAVLNSCRALEGRGISVTYVPVDAGGIVSPDAIRAAIRPETALISVMYANNEIGALQPIEEISRIAAEARIPLHTDAVQAAGKIAIDVNRLGVQLLSLSAHKFCGPKGAGALFVRKGLEIDPLLYGGPNERRRRAGTENVAGIVGLGKAAELARRDLAETSARMAELRDRLEKRLARGHSRRSRQWRSRAPHPQYLQPAFARRGKRVPAHRAGFGRLGLFGGRGVLLGRGRSLARAHRHRPHSCPSASQRAPQRGTRDHAGRDRSGAGIDPRGRGAPARRLQTRRDGGGAMSAPNEQANDACKTSRGN